MNQLPEDIEIFYADESGFEEHYAREYGYAQSGKPVYGEVPGTCHSRTSVVGAIDSNNDFFAGFAFKGYMNSALFVGWLQHIFAPSLKNSEKSVLLLDNASHHPKDEIYDIADEHGFTVIFLPRYSPDLNKIEKYWANVKNWLRLHLAKFDCFWLGLQHAFGCR